MPIDSERRSSITGDVQDDKDELPLSSVEKADGDKNSGKSARSTAGERLAASLQSRAARKAIRRGKQAEQVEAATLHRLESARQWLRGNRRRSLLVASAVLVALAVALGGTYAWRRSQGQASEKLMQVLSDKKTPGENATPRPASGDLRRWLAEHRRAAIAPWGQLAQAAALFEAGEHRRARQVWQDCLQRDGDEEFIRWRALEGIAVTYEAEANWRAAQQHYEKLIKSRRGASAAHGRLALARVLAAQGKDKEASAQLASLIKQLLGETRSDMAALRARVEHDQRLLKVDARAFRGAEALVSR